MFYCGEVRALADYADRLPEEVLRRYPLIELDLAWWRIVEWRFLEAERLLLAAPRPMSVRRKFMTQCQVK
jgi:hypothetical protein